MKKDIFKSTKTKIIWMSIFIVFLCLIAFSIITQFLYSSRVLERVDRQIDEQAHFICGDVINNPDGYSTDKNMDIPENFKGNPKGKPMRIPPNLIVIVYENDEFYSMSNNLYFSQEYLPQFPKGKTGTLLTLECNRYSFRGISLNQGEYTIQVLTNIDAEMGSINRLRISIFWSLIILLIIALVLAAFLASYVLKPIREAYNKQVYFVQDASHEMRTPLAVIKGKLELLANSWGDKIDDHFEHISKMMSEVRGLEKLNSDLLMLSKEDLSMTNNITEIQLDKFLDDISEFYTDLSEIKEKEFVLNRPEKNIEVQWDYNKMKRAIVILVENAFKYTGENGKIVVNVEDTGKFISISVKDNGIGIKKEDQKRIFDRFYRSEEVRGENISGTGIGLSILKSMSKNYGFKIKVDSEYNKGTEFVLSIPKVIK